MKRSGLAAKFRAKPTDFDEKKAFKRQEKEKRKEIL